HQPGPASRRPAEHAVLRPRPARPARPVVATGSAAPDTRGHRPALRRPLRAGRADSLLPRSLDLPERAQGRLNRAHTAAIAALTARSPNTTPSGFSRACSAPRPATTSAASDPPRTPSDSTGSTKAAASKPTTAALIPATAAATPMQRPARDHQGSTAAINSKPGRKIAARAMPAFAQAGAPVGTGAPR